MAGKVKWKLLELPLLRKTANQKQYSILGRIAEISATIEDLKDARSDDFTTSRLNSPALACAENILILENNNKPGCLFFLEREMARGISLCQFMDGSQYLVR